MCLYPRLIKNRKFEANKKNGGVIPAITDKRVMAVPVGCGKCMECKKKKAREWSVRMTEEIKDNKNGVMVTLTFSNESIKELSAGLHRVKGYEKDNEIAKLGLKRFLERWRKKNGKSIRHWMVTEIGHNGTENIHMHGIMWTDKPQEINEVWKYGFTWVGDKNKNGYVNEKTVSYIVKYIYKQDVKHKEYNSIILTSKGIGSGYMKRRNSEINKFNGTETKEYYRLKNGQKTSLPIYYRNKIYKEEEREKLWMQKLDEGKRYVDGKEIDVSKNTERYYKELKVARIKNKKLGYGDNRKQWDRKKYEEDRRTMLQETRINNSQSPRASAQNYEDDEKSSSQFSTDSIMSYEEVKEKWKNIW